MNNEIHGQRVSFFLLTSMNSAEGVTDAQTPSIPWVKSNWPTHFIFSILEVLHMV